MISQLLATKSHMSQAWDEKGRRIPVTILKMDACTVVSPTSKENRILVGAGKKKLKNVKKPIASLIKKAGISFGFQKLKEIVVGTEDKEALVVGTEIKPSQVLSVGDMVKVTGKSRGKGFTGVVKRHGFAGGPRTHGQSDRERAPGSLGSGTTPGRVFRNKRMAGRSGNAQVTTLNLTVLSLSDESGEITLKGIVPGTRNNIVMITKMA